MFVTLVGRTALRRPWLAALSVAFVAAVLAIIFEMAWKPAASPAGRVVNASDEIEHAEDSVMHVEGVHPRAGGLPRVTSQPGSVHAFEYADLYAKVSGYVVKQNVDIGDYVHEGQVLAEIDSPELRKELERDQALLEQSRAHVIQMKSRVAAAVAERQAAEASVAQAQAEIKRDEARRDFQFKQFHRIQDLFRLKSIDERLVDEKEDDYHAAEAAVEASRAKVATQQAQVISAQAKIEQAKADVVDAEAEVRVAEAALDKAKVFVAYLQLIAPYDAVITHRGFHRGDFIKSADQGALAPMYSIARTDVMRIVSQVPDRDVPYTNPGDPAEVEIDALPGTKFEGKVSRIARVEDARVRSMRVEIDLPNPEDLLRAGMYGRATIQLQEGARGAVLIPSSCLTGSARNGVAAVYVARDGVAYRTEVAVGSDNGVNVEVLKGLTTADIVITNNNGSIHDRTPVEVALANSLAPAALPTAGH
ncbi:MAG TPA: efflux RND transporter periplasmic adaptor subunit [Pirellulales bacterium]|nr:efflux RND transporter periplasmic adaptor subunit [Pirellulales bacterium]